MCLLHCWYTTVLLLFSFLLFTIVLSLLLFLIADNRITLAYDVCLLASEYNFLLSDPLLRGSLLHRRPSHRSLGSSPTSDQRISCIGLSRCKSRLANNRIHPSRLVIRLSCHYLRILHLNLI